MLTSPSYQFSNLRPCDVVFAEMLFYCSLGVFMNPCHAVFAECYSIAHFESLRIGT
jgi:hypothetical protein